MKSKTQKLKIKNKFGMQKKNIFNKKDSIHFDEDLFGKMQGLHDELEDDSSFDISISESDKKFPV